MVRISRDHDLPLHFEASSLKAPVAAAGWLAGVAATVAGIAGFARAGSTAAEAAAACLVLTGCVLVVLLVRCRRYEVTVGRKMLEFRAGPFRRILPAGCVERASPRPATGWRRLFASHELQLTVGVETRPLILPTNDPDDLRVALVGSSERDR